MGKNRRVQKERKEIRVKGRTDIIDVTKRLD